MVKEEFFSELSKLKKYGGYTKSLYREDVEELFSYISGSDRKRGEPVSVKEFGSGSGICGEKFLTKSGRFFVIIRPACVQELRETISITFGKKKYINFDKFQGELMATFGRRCINVHMKYNEDLSFVENCFVLLMECDVLKEKNEMLFPKELISKLINQKNKFLIHDKGNGRLVIIEENEKVIYEGHDTFYTIDFRYENKDYKMFITRKLKKLCNSLRFYITTKEGMIYSSGIYFLKDYDDENANILKIMEEDNIIF